MTKKPPPTPTIAERSALVNVTPGQRERLEIPHSADTSYLTHGLFRYVGKLPPPLMAYLLNNFTSRGDLVVDPMCGGGTTAIEAVSSGRSSKNFDINPVSRLVTAAVSDVTGALNLVDFAETIATEARACPPPLEFKNYFSDDAYGLIRHGLDAARSPAEQMLVLSIARSASFANTKKINTVVDTTKTPKPARQILLRSAAKFEPSYVALAETMPGSSTVAAAPSTVIPMADESADFVLLHPPYLTNTAFSEVTHLQLLLLGADPFKLRSKELAYRGSYFHVTNGLRKYLVGWSSTIQEAARILHPGGHVAVINGDGRIDGVRIPIGAITEEFAADLGLKTRFKAFHVLNNHTGMTLSRRMTGQHVLVFEK